MEPTRIAVIGGGISGLTAAHRLVRLSSEAKPLEVTLFEARDRVGGHAWTTREDGFLVESGPNGYLERDHEPELGDLVTELGLGSEKIVASRRTSRRFVYRKGKLRLLPSSPLSLLGTSALTPAGKIRLLLEPWAQRAQAGAEETVYQFSRRRLGREAAEALIDPAISGIWAGDSRELSLEAAFPRMLQMEREHGSLIRAMVAAKKKPVSKLCSFRGGMSTLIDGLRERTARVLRVGSSIRRLVRVGDDWLLLLESGERRRFDRVILALPAGRAAEVVEALDESLATELRKIAFAGVAVVALAYRSLDLRDKVSGYGYLACPGEGLVSLGALWDSSIFEGRAPSGYALVRVLLGGWRRPDVMTLPDDQLIDRARREFERVMQLNAVPIRTWVWSWPRAIPQYRLGHLDLLRQARDLASRHPGLDLCGTSYDGISFSSGVASGERVSRRVFEGLPVRNQERLVRKPIRPLPYPIRAAVVLSQ